MIYCQHPTVFPISFICTASHQCQRILCSECTQNHGVNQKFLLYLNNFQEKLKTTIQENNFVNNSMQRQQIHIEFKSLFHSIEMLVKKMVENFNEEITKLLKQIEIIDNKFESILTKDTPLTELSIQDIGFLVEIIMNKKLSTWNKQKNSLFQSLNTMLKKVNENFQKKSFLNYQQQQQERQDINCLQENRTINSEKKKFIWQVGTNQKKSRMFDDATGRFINIQLGITFTNDNRIQYIKHGAIIRSDQIKDISKKHKVMTNVDQIMNLYWVGKYGQNNLKIGKWTIQWQGKTLQDVGGEYSDDEKKQGKWKEIIKNYWSKAQVYKVGEYKKGLRIGNWKYIYRENVIGGGKFNEQGKKKGQWIELGSDFSDWSFVTYKGEYQNGIKVGRWDIWYRDQWKKENYLIGGGSYDVGRESIKIGKWIELSDFFDNWTQVTYEGEYHNGKKINKWNIKFRENINKPFEQIGGGQYDERGNENKIGKWIELYDETEIWNQVTYEGEYNNGKKVNRWNIYYEKKQIGGGSYAQDGNKVGKWNELTDDFRHSSQIFFNGEYKNGKKIGCWHIYYQDSNTNENIQIAGGSYDEEDNDNKIGKWIELSEGFYLDFQIIYKGEYKNNKKVNKWEILMRETRNEQFEKIGDGSYDEGGTGFKIGEWKEFSDFPNKNKQLIYTGLYQNNKKVGVWIEKDLKNQDHRRDIKYDN